MKASNRKNMFTLKHVNLSLKFYKSAKNDQTVMYEKKRIKIIFLNPHLGRHPIINLLLASDTRINPKARTTN